MATTDTNVQNLIINKLTQAQYNTITPSATELYMITDATLSSTDVTDALGYTPYDSSNPNGYTSNVGTVTSVNNTLPDSNGNVSLTIPTVDNSTITKNVSGQLQTVAVKDNRSGDAIKTWTGTQQQYDAIATKDANTIYNITDSTDVALTVLDSLYPVGSYYIASSSLSACPLATLGVGTWSVVGTSIITTISSVSVYGDGKTLGLTNGTVNCGLGSVSDNTGYLIPNTNTYGQNVQSTIYNNSESRGAFGVTTDSTKSGLTGFANSTSLSVKIWERTA